MSISGILVEHALYMTLLRKACPIEFLGFLFPVSLLKKIFQCVKSHTAAEYICDNLKNN